MAQPKKSPSIRTGELLKLCREMKGLSQREAAAACGVSCPFISQVETGKNNLGFETAIMLCDFYGISLDRLANTVRKHEKIRQKDGGRDAKTSETFADARTSG